eukprot:scaffold14308_cov297-Alexandrium_tamarense.AAC.1
MPENAIDQSSAKWKRTSPLRLTALLVVLASLVIGNTASVVENDEELVSSTIRLTDENSSFSPVFHLNLYNDKQKHNANEMHQLRGLYSIYPKTNLVERSLKKSKNGCKAKCSNGKIAVCVLENGQGVNECLSPKKAAKKLSNPDNYCGRCTTKVPKECRDEPACPAAKCQTVESVCVDGEWLCRNTAKVCESGFKCVEDNCVPDEVDDNTKCGSSDGQTCDEYSCNRC